MNNIREEIAEIIGIQLPPSEEAVNYKVLETVEEDGYTRQLIEYASGEDMVSAYLLLPDKLGNNPAILINHQHNREHHLGKSEVCGLAGNPLQAFGPELALWGILMVEIQCYFCQLWTRGFLLPAPVAVPAPLNIV